MAGEKRLAIYQPIGKRTVLYVAQMTLRLLPQAQLMLLYLSGHYLLVKVYMPLLRPLATIVKLVFCWVTVQVTRIFILWHCSLKMLRAMHLILIRKLWKEVLVPALKILWHSRAAARYLCFHLAGVLQWCAAKWALELLGFVKQRSLPAISSARHQLHNSMSPFLQENYETYQTLLRPVMKQIIFSLFLGLLDGVQEALKLTAKVTKCALTLLFNLVRPTLSSACKAKILDNITSTLPHPCMSLCTRFGGPSFSTLKDIPQTFAALKFVVATEQIISGPGKYGLDGTTIPLHVRFQTNIRMRNVRNAFAMKETSAPLKQVKVACVLFIAIYLSVFYSAVKAII